MPKLILAVSSIALLGLALISCGKPAATQVDQPQPSVAPPTPPPPPNPVPITGIAAQLGTQCPYGSSSQPKPLDLALWYKEGDAGCPISMASLEFAQQFQPIFLSGKCMKKTISARTQERNRNDLFWEIPINGDFSLEMEGILGRLKDDGKGHLNCVVPAKVRIDGFLKCLDPHSVDDKANIGFKIWYYPQDKLPPSSMDQVPAGTPICELPPDCYFWANSEIKQCQ